MRSQVYIKNISNISFPQQTYLLFLAMFNTLWVQTVVTVSLYTNHIKLTAHSIFRQSGHWRYNG